MKKNIFLLLLFTFSAISLLKAQNENQESPEEKTGFDKSRLFFGGSFGLSFGDAVIVNVSPQLGYRFSRYFAAGVGINGQYSEFKYRDGNNNIYQRQKYGVVGLNVFGRVYPIPQLFAQVQPEMNYVWYQVKNYDYDYNSKENKFVPSVLIGGGGEKDTTITSSFPIAYSIVCSARAKPGGSYSRGWARAYGHFVFAIRIR